MCVLPKKDPMWNRVNKVKDKGWARPRDTTTSNEHDTVYLDTDPTYEDTTEKAVVVVSPLSALISDQMERRKSLKSARNSVHMSSVS